MNSLEKNGQIKVVEFWDDRWYGIEQNGEKVWIASVTTQLGIEEKPMLARWRGDLGNREADLRSLDAANRGKRIHHAWYMYLMGGAVVYNPWESPNYSDTQLEELKKEKNGLLFILQSQDEMLQVWKLQQWFELVHPQPLHCEQVVYDIPLNIAGTLDVSFFIEKGKYPVNGRNGLEIPVSGIYIADLKTGKYLDDSFWNQVGAYSKAYKTMGFGKPDGGLILHTGASTRTGIEGFSCPVRTKEELEKDFEGFQILSKAWMLRHAGDAPKAFKFPSLLQRS